jgi:hypothetical protein
LSRHLLLYNVGITVTVCVCVTITVFVVVTTTSDGVAALSPMLPPVITADAVLLGIVAMLDTDVDADP